MTTFTKSRHLNWRLAQIILTQTMTGSAGARPEETLFEEFTEWRFKDSPEFATMVGVHTFDDKVSARRSQMILLSHFRNCFRPSLWILALSAPPFSNEGYNCVEPGNHGRQGQRYSTAFEKPLFACFLALDHYRMVRRCPSLSPMSMLTKFNKCLCPNWSKIVH